ncbi:MAG: SAM-dependent methyltransferase [Gammaproteobacteria bacterium]
MTTEPISGSFRDPSGFLYYRNGILLRQINPCYADDFEHLISSGLYDSLSNSGLLIKHEEADLSKASTANAYKVIAPEVIPFISYPYEWSFGQLKDAALATLEIQKQALDKSMSLKDASAYNIQFHNGRAVFIDTLSFEKYEKGTPWVAYRQFCQHFLAPLALMAHVDVGLNQLFRTNIDGIPLDLATSLLPFSKRLNPTLSMHLWLHSRSQGKAHTQRDSAQAVSGSFSETAFRGLLDNLRSGISKLNWKPGGSEWFDYYDANNNYGDTGLAEKEALVQKVVEKLRPNTVWDLGGNTGRFTRIAVKAGAKGVCFDIDPGCVESNYRYAKANNETDILPLLLDLTNPSPGIGWANHERYSLLERGPVDLILALGLIHHLVIANNVPFLKVAKMLGRLCEHLVIEFVPRGDSQIDKLLLNRRDVFTDYEAESFEGDFSQFFSIKDSIAIPDTHRTLYVMESLPNEST